MTITTELAQRVAAITDRLVVVIAPGDISDKQVDALSDAIDLLNDSITALVAKDKTLQARKQAVEMTHRRCQREKERADAAERRVAELEARPEQQPVAWPNHCDKSVPAALRYLAEKPRPAYGNSPYNTEHLYQLAREIEAMAGRELYGSAPAAQPVTVKLPPAVDESNLPFAALGANAYRIEVIKALAAAGITIAEGELYGPHAR